MRADKAGYPSRSITLEKFPSNFGDCFPRPVGFAEEWPPLQIKYLDAYLRRLGCKTILIESHYVDRDYILDLSVFYARSLRNYPNFCERLHFLNCEFSQADWNAIFDADPMENGPHPNAVRLRNAYLGFQVVKPLPGCPVGRTVLRTLVEEDEGMTRMFGGIRRYSAHIGGIEIEVEGLAFQQQDRGVSACATTALWSSLHKVAHDERILVPSPAQITEAASRYLLMDGRSFPSEGLNIEQMCEAIRGTGLQPLVIRSVSLEEDRAQIVSYLSSGLPPILALGSGNGGSGHAVCTTGFKLGPVTALPQSNSPGRFTYLAGRARHLYVHDDRLGPYARTGLSETTPQKRTALEIDILGSEQTETSFLLAVIVAVPDKIRLPMSRLIEFGVSRTQEIARLAGNALTGLELNTQYRQSCQYLRQSRGLQLSPTGLAQLCCDIVLPRFIGLIEIASAQGPVLDILVDTTDTLMNPSALVFVKRTAFPVNFAPQLNSIAQHHGAQLIF